MNQHNVSRVFARACSVLSLLCGSVALAQTCPVGTQPSTFNLVKNGNFSQAITNTVAPIADGSNAAGDNTNRTTLRGGTFNFGSGASAGTFRSQAGNTSVSNTAGANGTTTFYPGPQNFALQSGTYGSATAPFNLNQVAFPGDSANNVPASATWFYSNGNYFGRTTYGNNNGAFDNNVASNGEYLLWQQDVNITGWASGKSYLFFSYASNVINNDRSGSNFINDASDDPVVRLRTGTVGTAGTGDDGLPSGTLVAGPVRLLESALQTNSQAGMPATGATSVGTANNELGGQNGWYRISATLTPSSNQTRLKFTSAAPGENGDDFSLTQIGYVECVPPVAVSKTAGTPVFQGSDTWDIPFSLTVKNLSSGAGARAAENVQVRDVLATTFPTASVSSWQVLSSPTPSITNVGGGALALNGTFAGSSNTAPVTNLLSGDQNLPVGAEATLSFTVRVVVTGSYPKNFNNTAIATTASTAGGTATFTDNSQNGGTLATATESVTPIALVNPANLKIGLAKTRSAVTANGDGTYDVTYTLLARNYSNPSSALSNVQVTDSLSAFGTYTATNPPATAGQYTISSAPVVSGVANGAALSANSSYNGSSDTNLLVAASSSLPNGGTANATRSSALIAFTVKFRPDTSSSLTVNNTATASAGPGVTDVSDNQVADATPSTAGDPAALNPDSNDNGDPSEGNESDSTPFVLTFIPTSPSLQITKNHVGDWTVGDLARNYTLTVTNTGTASTTGTIFIKDTLPANMVLGTITPSSGSITTPTTAAGVTSFDFTPAGGALAANASVTFTVNVSLPITESATSTFVSYDEFPNTTNRASVGGGGDPFNGGAALTPGDAACDTNHCASDPTVVKPLDIPSPQVCSVRGGTRGTNLLTGGDFGTSSSATLPTFGPGLGVLPANVVGPSSSYLAIDGTTDPAPTTWTGSPEDGEYSIVNSNRARGDTAWFEVLDHTTASPLGRYMMVNAADLVSGGTFYQQQITVTPNTNYDFSFWMMNVIANNSGLRPNIQLEFEFNDGRVEVVGTGVIPNTDKPIWREYAAVVNSVSATQMTVRFKNLSIGGGGNDLALDDLTFTPCTFSSVANISGKVFVDPNSNGILDGAAEPGRIAGVRVELVDRNNNNAVMAIAITNATGDYQFTNIATGRDYTVRVDGTDPDLAGYSVTLPNPATRDINALPVSGSSNQNFGYLTANELAVSKVVQAATTPFGPLTVRNDGQSFRYLLTVQNQGSNPQPGVTVSDALPSGVVLSATPPVFRLNGTVDNTQTYAGGIWTVGTLASGSSATLELYVTLSSGGSQDQIDNTATLQNPPVGDNPANNTATASILPNPIKFEKTVRNLTAGGIAGIVANAKPTETLEYCVTASSTLAAARDVNVSDPILPNQTFVTGSITGVSNGAVTAATVGNVGTVTGTLTGVVSGTPKTLCFRTTID
jgi:uncharacterized repeat protein (TIGR01451 family)